MAPLALGAVALVSAISVIPLLGTLVMTGRLSAGAAGLSATALTAGCAALALAGPDSAFDLPNSGLALTLVVVAVGLAVAAWARDRILPDERGRWLGVILALALAESALAAALLAPGSALDEYAWAILLVAAVVALGAAADLDAPRGAHGRARGGGADRGRASCSPLPGLARWMPCWAWRRSWSPRRSWCWAWGRRRRQRPPRPLPARLPNGKRPRAADRRAGYGGAGGRSACRDSTSGER